MKKKIFSVLTLMLLVVTSFVFTACSKRYDKLEFVISYAFSEENPIWHEVDLSKGITINYDDKTNSESAEDSEEKSDNSEDNDKLVIDGIGRLYFKVEIKNVKEKYIEDIIVSKVGGSYTGINFTSTTVEQGQVFSVELTGNVSTSLKFYETNSGKEAKIDFNVSRSLESISADVNNIPALAYGGKLNLANIGNLTYHPTQAENPNSYTNQTGVAFEVAAVGRFIKNNEEMVFVSAGLNAIDNINLEGNILSLSDDFEINADCNIVQIKAQSVHYPEDEEKSATFYVALIDGQDDSNITSKFKNENGNDAKEFVLYVDSTKYSKTTLYISTLTGIYSSGVLLNNGKTAKYELQAYVDGERYDFDGANSSLGVNGLLITRSNNLVTINAINLGDGDNEIEFRWVISNLKYESSNVENDINKQYYGTKVVVQKRILPTDILINEQSITPGVNDTGIVYSTTSESYKGLELNLRAVPLDVNTNANIYISKNDNLIIADANGRQLKPSDTGYYTVASGSKIYVKFVEGLYDKQDITFTIDIIPKTFNGEELKNVENPTKTITYKLKKQITASDIEVQFYNGSEGQQLIDNKLYIDGNYKTTPFIMKVFYKGEALDAETITLSVENDSATNPIKFSNNFTTIRLDSNYVTPSIEGNAETDLKYKTFIISLTTTEIGATGKVKVVAGNEEVGLNKSFLVESVQTTTSNLFNLEANCSQGNYVVDLTDEVLSPEANVVSDETVEETKYYYAISQSKLIKFKVNNNAVKGISLSVNDNNTLSINWDKNSNWFSISDNVIGPRTIKLSINYFSRVTEGDYKGAVTEKEHRIEIEIFVCGSIASVNPSGETIISYINKQYKDASTVEVNFDARNMYNGKPTNEITFNDGKTTETKASGIRLSVEGPDFKNGVDLDKILIKINNSDIDINSLKDNDCSLNVLEGTIEVELLSQEFSADEITLVFISTFFGQEVKRETYTIKRVYHTQASTISLEGVNTNINGVYQINMSFMDVKDGDMAVATFKAKAIYDVENVDKFTDLDFTIYPLTLSKDKTEWSRGSAVTLPTSYITVKDNGGEITLSVSKQLVEEYKTGEFELVVSTRDSYNDSTDTYSNSVSIRLSVADGKISPYKITSVEELKKINNNLDANYVLGANIEVAIDDKFLPIGNRKEFTGSFKGDLDVAGENNTNLTTRYTITVLINGSAKVEAEKTDFYAGLFARIGATGVVSNINIIADFSDFVVSSTSVGSVNLGALAGENKGIISGVNLDIVSGVNLTGVTSATINFGGLVGVNSGEIKLTESIECIAKTEISSTCEVTHNIGVVVGLNSGTITGKYVGQESLNNFEYSVVANLYVSNINKVGTSPCYYVGGVAGENTGNISNVLIGGKISIKEVYAENITGKTEVADGAIAGIAGNNAGEIETNAVLALDLVSETALIPVAGMVGVSTAGTITDVRVMSAQVTFKGLGETTGKITGAGVVAGAVANAENTTISYIAIESFIQVIEIEGNSNSIFYMLEGPQVAGLVHNATGSTTIKTSFVNAHINNTNTANTTYLTSNISDNISETNTYFLGRVADNKNLTANSTYAVVYDDIEYKRIDTSSTDDNTTWAKDEKVNAITVNGTTYNFPYLLKDGKQFMIVRPTEITASVDKDYILEISSIYVPTIEYTNVTHTAIINYRDAGSTNNNIYNTYYLVDHTDENGNVIKGLIDLTIVPEDVIGGVKFEVVQGSNFAYIDNNKTIIFKGVSRNKQTGVSTPIVIKCSSVFNPDLVEYVVFFTELGITDIVLTSSDISMNAGVAEITTFTGNISHIVTFNVENVGVAEFDTILNSKAINALSVEYTAENNKVGSEDIVTVDVSNALSGGILLSVNKDVMENESAIIELTFDLKLNLTTYNSTYFPQIDTNDVKEDYIISLGTTTLNVIVFKSATNLTVAEGGDYVEYTTEANLKYAVDIETSFIDSADSLTKAVQTNGFEYGNDTLKLGVKNKDSIRLKFEVLEGKEEINKLLKATGETYLTKLFNYSFNYKLNEDKSGYRYNIELCLKEEHNYRLINNNIKIKLYIYATSNDLVYDTVEFLFKPAEISTIRIENYQAKSLNAYTTYTDLLTKSYSETATIIPGGLGGVMLIYLEPSYANIIEGSVTLTSSSILVPDLQNNSTKSVSIVYEQLLYNKYTGKYETILPRNEQVEGGIKLVLQSGKDENGNPYYDGIIYVHTMLDKFAGVEPKTITSTLTAQTGSKENPTTRTITKNLLTTYLPGAVLNYNGVAVGDGYLVEKGTSNNNVNITIYGYQFNSNPSIEMEWNLNNFEKFTYEFSEYSIAYEQEFIDNIGNLYLLDDDGKYVLATEFKTGVTTYYKPTTKKTIYGKDEEDNVITYNIGDYVTPQISKNYIDAVKNADGSYTLPVNLIVSKEIPANFTMNATLTLANELDKFTSEKSSINFYPTDYVLKGVNVSELGDNTMKIAINNSDTVELAFTTANEYADYSADIYKLLNNIGIDIRKLFTFGSYSLLDVDKNNSIENAKFESSLNKIEDANYIQIIGKDEFSGYIDFEVEYSYEKVDGMYVLKFSETGGRFNLETNFKLNIHAATTEENAIPISTAEEFKTKLTDGADFILMNDIVLENYTPTTAKIASLDGNNKKITIKSFAIDVNSKNYGLFAEIGTYQDANKNTHKTILKNVIVDYSQCADISFLNNSMTNIVFGGLVAVNNGGLIYNCDVMNISNVNKTINLLIDPGATFTFGGLVGVNNGIITNSRVGRNEYTEIDVRNGAISTKHASTLTFKIWGGQELELDSVNGFTGIVGGFIGENGGKVSSSYVSNTNIINYSMEQAKTAGFVANNKSGGTISYSYISAGESDATSTFLKSTRIESPTDGLVAGFVFTNDGDIDNAYVNTHLVSDSNYLAGFVYENAGKISEAYSAVTMNNVAGGTDVSERPFVGMDEEDKILQTGTIENVYYLAKSTANIIKTEPAKGLIVDNFADPDNLVNFVFIQSTSKSEREQGVWSYVNSDGRYVILPELVGANTVAHTTRYLVESDADKYIYTYAYASTFEPGTKNNPFIIRNVEEYNKILTNDTYGTSTESKITTVGYMRMINDIDFGTTAIKTRAYFSLGEKEQTGKTTSVTSFDGNGMTISGIYLDALSGYTNGDSVGLFSEINNAYIKNVNLKFVVPTEADNLTSTSSVTYVGGLAGIVHNGVIINVNLSGESTVITGNNFVGGMAGIVNGESMLYGITTNLSVLVNENNQNKFYYREEDYSQFNIQQTYKDYSSGYSYGGGLAGVIDLDERRSGTENFNVSYIEVQGYNMATMPEGSYNILADYAGGVAGYVNENTRSLRVKFLTGTTTKIKGQTSVGGLYGVSLGEITASQVSAIEDDNNQHKYDTSIGDYIIDLENNVTDAKIDAENSGNLTLIEGYGYSGGLVGIAIGGFTNSSYSKASFATGTTIGGLIGLSVNTNVTYSYAIPYINITTDLQQVGGLIGSAYNTEANANTAYTKLLKLAHGEKAKDNTGIQFTFSTLIVNKNDLSGVTLDYLCGDYSSNTVMSGTDAALTKVNVGTINVTEIKNASNTNNIKLSMLYDIENYPDVQERTFSDLFSSWAISPYWSLDNTKYFPLLKQDEVLGFIPIYNESDLKQIQYNPDLNYMIKNDIQLSHIDGNYVLDCEFTGILMGDVQNNNGVPTIRGISLSTTENGNTGFIRATIEAQIVNLNFEWAPQQSANYSSIQINHTIGSVGGVSCDDIESLFSNLKVTVGTAADSSTHFLNVDSSIHTFGGIVATGTNSTIVDCTFIGDVTTTLQNDSSTDSYFGLLAGSISTDNKNLQPDEAEKAATITNSYIGTDGKDVAVNLTINNGSNLKDNNIGIAVGYAENASISGIQVGGQAYESAQKVNLNVHLNSVTSNSHIGGLIGNSSGAILSNNNVSTNITIAGTTSDSSKTTAIGGLAGSASGRNASIDDIYNNANVANINLSEFSGTTVYVSGGVANATGSLKVTRNVFTGYIKTYSDDEETKADSDDEETKHLYAGGAVGTTNSSVELDEVVSTVNIFATATKMYIGGLVGGASNCNVTILHSISAGRIVPINTYIEDATINIGGLVGLANEVNTKKSFSTTSIITDGIAGQQFKSESYLVKALFGTVSKVTTTDTYYSSDVALCDEKYGTNLTASTLYGGTLNSTLTAEEGTPFKKGTDGVPYLATMSTNLTLYEVVNDEFKYYSGTSLRPDVIDDDIDFSSDDYKDKFTYFRLETLKEFSGTLNGVLIGSDTEYTTHSTIAIINAHSAVSNVHLNLGTSPSGTVTGLIANENNGVIFNSSVRGHNLTITGEHIGLITKFNAGLISHSYSTAEVVKVNATSIGGIVYENKGTIVSSYFTGYINNFININTNSAKAAGISIQQTNSSYIYNTYMAGVIVDATSNAFAQSTANFNGYNNHIDSLINGASNLPTGVSVIQTSDLMSNKDNIIKGSWNKGNITVTVDAENNYVETLGATFGYNYGYPVYNFNKYTAQASGEIQSFDATKYQEYTGTGEYYATLTELESRYNSLIDNETVNEEPDAKTEYENALKIPHLGVLTAVHGMLNTSRNYVVIYDLNGSGKGNWTPIGTGDAVNGFANTGGFNGVFVSNRGIGYNPDTSEHLCLIEELQTSGLFTNIGGAYIGNVLLGNMSDLSESGALGKEVTGELTLNNVSFTQYKDRNGKTTNSKITAGGNDIGGLFGNVSTTGLVSLKNVNTKYLEFKTSKNVGGITAKMSGGKITGVEGNKIIVNTIEDENTFIALLGGVAGEMLGGTIEKITVILNETTEPSNIYVESFGGIAGKVIGEATITGCKVDTNGQQFNIIVNNPAFIGMLAGSLEASGDVKGKITATAFDIANLNIKISSFAEGIHLNENATNQGVGVLLGKQTGDLFVQLNNSGVSLTSLGVFNLGGIAGIYESGIVNVAGLDISSLQGVCNVGGIFGRCDGDLTYTSEELDTDGNPKIKSIFDDVDNEDEVYANDFLSSGKFATILIPGDGVNFGGLFGLLTKNVDGTLKTITNYNPIYIGTHGDTATNIGGIAGKFTGTTAENLTNNGEILYNGEIFDEHKGAEFADYGEYIPCVAMNVGGVFGYVNGEKEINSINNTAEVQGYQNVGGLIGYAKGITMGYKTITNEDGSTSQQEKSTIISNQTVKGIINVGGVFGYLDGAIVKRVYQFPGSINVQGNANIGGFVGFANKTTIVDGSVGQDGTSEVKGIYYAYTYKVDVEEQTDVFFPTSVGGFAGMLKETGLANSSCYNVSVTSCEEGVELADEKGHTISTISNNMLDVHNATYTSGIRLKADENYTPINFHEIESGFGGFVGTIDDTTMNAEVTHNGSQYFMLDNSVGNPIINAQLGINVGTFYGYVGYENSINDVSQIVSLPILYTVQNTEVNIDGGYNIGGVVGYLNYDGSSNVTFTNADIQHVHYDGSEDKYVTITLQSTWVGMYVGGLFGKTNADNATLTINNSVSYVDIKIDTKQSYYMGGLVGRLETNGHSGEEKFTGNVGTDSTSGLVTTSEIDDISSAAEFGGLIGMLKVTDTSGSGVTVKVEGTHYYPFTVNTIENSNYSDQAAKMHSNELNDELYLVAMASYTNKDSFNIVGSSNSSFYTKAKTEECRYTEANWATEKNKLKAEGGLYYKYKNNQLQSIQVTVTQIYMSLSNGTEMKRFIRGTVQLSTDSLWDGWIFDPIIYPGQKNYDEGYYIELFVKFEYVLKDNPAKNPINSASKGWHKTYTGFRVMQRNIPQTFGDSIAVLYDAANITYVSVAADNSIDYTIYEEAPGQAKMYSKIGIFSAYVAEYEFTGINGVNYTVGDYAIPGRYKHKEDATYAGENISFRIDNIIYLTDSVSVGGFLAMQGHTVRKMETVTDVKDWESMMQYYTVSDYPNGDKGSGVAFILDILYNQSVGNGSVFEIQGGEHRPSIETAETDTRDLNEQFNKYQDKYNAAISDGNNKKAKKLSKKLEPLKNILSNSYASIDMGSEYANDLYLSDNSNAGLLATSSTRRMFYKKENGKYIADTNFDKQLENNGYMYVYYSEQRPADYYTKYWQYIDDDGITYTANKNDSNYNNETWFERYIYQNGAYYMSVEAGTVYYEKHQNPTSIISVLTPAQYYYSSDGYYYVHGKYNASTDTYSFDNYNNEYGNSEYKTSERINFIYKSGYSGAGLEGYDYIGKTLYNSFTNDYTISNDENECKYYKLNLFTPSEDNLSSMTENVHYISAKLESTDGKISKVYYKIDGWSETASATDIANSKSATEWNSYTFENTANSYIVVKLYPSTNDKDLGTYATDVYFVNSKNDLTLSGMIISKNVTYYYLEGGYNKVTGNTTVDIDGETYFVSDGLNYPDAPNSDTSIPAGYLVKAIFTSNTESAIYNNNKFLTNEEYQLFTRYKYVENDNVKVQDFDFKNDGHEPNYTPWSKSNGILWCELTGNYTGFNIAAVRNPQTGTITYHKLAWNKKEGEWEDNPADLSSIDISQYINSDYATYIEYSHDGADKITLKANEQLWFVFIIQEITPSLHGYPLNGGKTTYFVESVSTHLSGITIN